MQAPMNVESHATHPNDEEGAKMITRDRCCGFSKKCAIITGAVVSVVITIAVIVIVVLMTQNSGTTGGQGADVSSIISGTDTKYEDYPFYADLFSAPSLGSFDYFKCGASMITSKHALTAQHCVVGGVGNVGIGSRVRIGGSVERTVVKVDNLDNYDNDSSNGNDLSILELNEPVTQEDFSFDYSPINICEDKEFTTTGTEMLILGNGFVNFTSLADTLQKLDVVRVTGRPCNGITTDSLVCLEPEKGTGTSGACYGDSGGPLIYNGCLAGVSSLIFGDCGKGAFAYVSTYEHRNWIVENTEAPCICVNGWKEKEESGKALVQMDFGNNYTTAYLSCAEWKGYTLKETQCNIIKDSGRLLIDTCCR